jgi:hypothetical protein
MRTSTPHLVDRPVSLPHDRLRRRRRLDILITALVRPRPGRVVLAA